MTVRELEVITRLESFNANVIAIENLIDRIASLDAKATSIRSNMDGSERVGSSATRSPEDARIENIILRDIAANDLEYCKLEVRQMEKALKKLSENERKVLDRMYINKSKDSVRSLCNELGYEEAQIYRIRKAAINNIATLLYGSRRK